MVHMTLYMTVTLVNAAAASGNAGKIECWPCTSKYFATEDNWLKFGTKMDWLSFHRSILIATT